MKNSASVTPLDAKRRSRITADDVYQAADSLLVEGQKPTIEAVRAKLGGGSPNTVNEHLNAWWPLLGRRIIGTPGEPLPFPKEVSDLLLQLWTTSLREAQNSLEHAWQLREAAIALREAEVGQKDASLSTRALAIEEVNATSRTTLETLRQQLDDYTARLAIQDKELTNVRAELKAMQAALVDEQQKRSEVQQQLQRNLEFRIAERAELDRHVANTEARAAREIDRARLEAKETHRKSAEIEKALRSEIRELKEDVRDKIKDHDELQLAHRQLLATRMSRPPPKSPKGVTKSPRGKSLSRRRQSVIT